MRSHPRLGSPVCYCSWLPFFRFEQSKVTITAAIEDINASRASIHEDEEVVAEQLHLLNRFFLVHRLDREDFAANYMTDSEVLLVKLDSRLQSAEILSAVAAALLLTLIPLDLSVHLIDNRIHRSKQIVGALFCTEDSATNISHCNLSDLGAAHTVGFFLSQVNSNFAYVWHIPIKPLNLALDVR